MHWTLCWNKIWIIAELSWCLYLSILLAAGADTWMDSSNSIKYSINLRYETLCLHALSCIFKKLDSCICACVMQARYGGLDRLSWWGTLQTVLKSVKTGTLYEHWAHGCHLTEIQCKTVMSSRVQLGTWTRCSMIFTDPHLYMNLMLIFFIICLSFLTWHLSGSLVLGLSSACVLISYNIQRIASVASEVCRCNLATFHKQTTRSLVCG